jgi:hypothetical protein
MLLSCHPHPSCHCVCKDIAAALAGGTSGRRAAEQRRRNSCSSSSSAQLLLLPGCRCPCPCPCHCPCHPSCCCCLPCHCHCPCPCRLSGTASCRGDALNLVPLSTLASVFPHCGRLRRPPLPPLMTTAATGDNDCHCRCHH